MRTARRLDPGSAIAQELHEHRSGFDEMSLGAGWRISLSVGDWWVTRWLGKSRGGVRISVFAPVRRGAAGWVAAAKDYLIHEESGARAPDSSGSSKPKSGAGRSKGSPGRRKPPTNGEPKRRRA